MLESQNGGVRDVIWYAWLGQASTADEEVPSLVWANVVAGTVGRPSAFKNLLNFITMTKWLTCERFI